MLYPTNPSYLLPSIRVVTGSQVSITELSPPAAVTFRGGARDNSGVMRTSSESLLAPPLVLSALIRYPYTRPYWRLVSRQVTVPFRTSAGAGLARKISATAL